MRILKIAIGCLILSLSIMPISAEEHPKTSETETLLRPHTHTVGWTDHTFSSITPYAISKIAPQVLATAQNGQKADTLVILAHQANLKGAVRHMQDKANQGHSVYESLYEHATRDQAALRAWLDAQGIPYRAFYIVNALHIEADRDLLLRLAARSDVARLAANPQVAMHPTLPVKPETKPLAVNGIEWGVSKIGAPQLWDLGYTGQGVVVAGQDTGYDWTHPALTDKYRGAQGTLVNHNYHWHDAIHSGGGICGADSPAPCDDHSHGTHTMGTMVGDDGGTHQIGVAPGAQWIGCRNMNQGVGTPATYIECFEFFLAPYPVGETPDDGNANPAMAPDVINNSWSCPTYEGCDWDTLQATVEAVRAAGIMVISSAANDGPSCSSVREPAALYDAVYTVGATGSNDGIASFSSRGPVTIDGSNRLKPDISAPGVSVYSSVLNGGYGTKQGTSMASPHVAGAVALLWSARPDLRGQLTQTENLISQTAVPRYSTQCGDPANTVPNNVYGWGRLDAFEAVQLAITNTGLLTGTVYDPVGTPLPQANVLAVSSLTQTVMTRTDVAGDYALRLISDTYTVTATYPGYGPVTYPNISITTEQTRLLPITLTCQFVDGVDFSYEPTELWAQIPVTFTGYAITGTEPIAYTWNFGHGASAYQGNPITYTFPKTASDVFSYTVTMTATNTCSQQTTQKLIAISTPLSACHQVSGLSFDYVPKTIFVNNPVQFTAMTISGTQPITYTWHFGDGAAQSVGNPITHTFPISNNITSYRVTVTATNACHQQAMQEWVTVYVTVTECRPVEGLSFGYVPNTLFSQDRVQFTATTVTGTQPITYTWNFGDDTAQIAGNPVTHTFPTDTNITPYRVTVTATNACSQQSIWQWVTIHPYRIYLPLIMRDTHTR